MISHIPFQISCGHVQKVTTGTPAAAMLSNFSHSGLVPSDFKGKKNRSKG
jgi:hypothetical protein